MKHGKFPIWIIVACNVILVMVCAILYFNTDRTAPVIEFSENEAVYTTSMNTDILLEGVSAYDNKDKDVTEKIVIEKISENISTGKATVFYAVSDQKGNVSRRSREFPANYDLGSTSAGIAGIDETRMPEITDSKENAEAFVKEPVTEQEPAEITEADDNTADDVDASPTPEPTQTPEPTATPRKIPSPRPTRTPDENNEEQNNEEVNGAEAVPEEPVPEVPEQPVPEQGEAEIDYPPYLSLKAATVKTPAGMGPAWVDVIKTMSDDHDDYSTLLGNLRVSKYDRNTPGTYAVTVQTHDSAGNYSAECQIVIIVE
ncbi:MAG: hypothetical protein K5870_10975 [Lachnospiraceae bacterium]|nr:hypothetical protein [Lachnospiraceae bacterium]